jgi:ribose 5-phosphate isomerase RpiB
VEGKAAESGRNDQAHQNAGGNNKVEMDSGVVQRIVNNSAVEFAARRVNMGTNTRDVPRSGGVSSAIVAPGQMYGNDDSTDDTVVLQTSKFAQGVPLTDEDMSDLAGVIDVIASRGADWAGSYAIHLDAAALGASGAGAMNSATPFYSVYNALTNNDTDASYTANTNYTAAASLAGSGGYEVLTAVFNKYETSRFFAQDRSIVIAHPAFKQILRNIVDNMGRPIFTDTSGLTTITGYEREGSTQDVPTLLDVPMLFSLGACACGVPSSSPTGNPLLIVGNRDHFILGTRSGPESKQERLPGQDTVELMYRARRAFHVGFPQALSLLEIT